MATTATPKRVDISILKAAELAAAAAIKEAREERRHQMREAKLAAETEIEEFRQQREAKLRSIQPEAQALESRIMKTKVETDSKIGSLSREYEQNKEHVMQMLMKVVLSIENPYAAE